MGADELRILQGLHSEVLSALALLPAGGDGARLATRISMALKDRMDPSADDPERAWRGVFRRVQWIYADALSDPALSDASPEHRQWLQRAAWRAGEAAGAPSLRVVRDPLAAQATG